ncbi:PD-(D/E)XK motif protein [Algoriphagus sp. SE2]|uniref:PD-(D/E)XK motif protein n=1 Tax=Algoriphagus sp. SE2 TaxID=3141536 RepID=UPI0031CCE437
MNNSELKSKWEDIATSSEKKGFKALRITATCIPDLFIALDTEGFRCLIFFLPAGLDVDTRGLDKNKLHLSYIPSKSVLFIKLKDSEFFDLFDDLILSIYSKINSISNPKKASHEFIATFYKWSYFFEDTLKKKLGEEQVQGLFGELFVLREFVEQCDPLKINSVLSSWKGPYDAPNDFILDNKNLEVKTKREALPSVKISSEFQLEPEHSKGLELVVLSVKLDLTIGQSIHNLLSQLVQKIREKAGDLTILFQALTQKGLTIDSLRDYNNHRFIVSNKCTYDCTVKGFPRLSTSNIPKEVSDLRYTLKIKSLNDFLIEEKKY